MSEIHPECEAVLHSSPQPTLKGKKVKAEGKGQSPTLLTSSCTMLLGGPGVRLLACAYSWQAAVLIQQEVFKACREQSLDLPYMTFLHFLTASCRKGST